MLWAAGPIGSYPASEKELALSVFQTPASMSICLSFSLSVRLSGNRGPLLTHLSQTHPLSLSFCISLLFLPFLHPSPCLSSLHLRGIWGQSSCCRIRSHPLWQNGEHHTDIGLLDRPIDRQTQHTHIYRHIGKQTCWLCLFYTVTGLSSSPFCFIINNICKSLLKCLSFSYFPYGFVPLVSSWKNLLIFLINSLTAVDVYKRLYKYNPWLPKTSIDVNYVFQRGGRGISLVQLVTKNQACKQRI